MTQQQVADRAGISRVAVSHLEAGINSPDARTVTLLAGLFGLEPHDLVDGTDYPAAKADRLPVVVARHTEIAHQVALMDTDLAWIVGPTPAVTDRDLVDAVVTRWRVTLDKLAATVLDPGERALLDAARDRLARVLAAG
jgi:transcriptional regulator with XRE-family HTH domain